MPAQALLEETGDLDEAGRVVRNRFNEAREAGLTLVESRLFAESDCDVGLLRACVRGECPPLLIARVLL